MHQIAVCLIFVIINNVLCNKIVDDICGPHQNRRLYLELGERGILTAYNTTTRHVFPVSTESSTTTGYSNKITPVTHYHELCNFELVTCPSCVITVFFRQMDLGHFCGGGSLLVDSPCRCDYVLVAEPPYEEVSGIHFCGIYQFSSANEPNNNYSYRSKTRTLSISLFFNEMHQRAFTLEYSSERNREYFKGSPPNSFTGSSNRTGSGTFTSPFFPTSYPRDYGSEYLITCVAELLKQNTTDCRVRLVFSDFQIASVSVMEFYDWNNQRIDVTSGVVFRPPVILSTGPSMTVRFYANGGSGLGFKAAYSFISDCGGYVENFGGAITMMNMVDRGIKTYDCLWLIQPPKNFFHLKSHLYLKVATFLDFASNTEIQIKQGLTSDRPLLEVLRHPGSRVYHKRPREHVIPVTSGFYVSLRGTFGPSSRLAIVYTSFNYMDCFAGSEFLCQNHRCIPAKLSCDGFDHCGDSSDEPASCFQEWDMEPIDRKWYSHTPNYYFPKIERYPDLKTTTLVFIVSSLGLVLLITALIVVLYRMGARARHQRELQNRLQTISELLDSARIEEIVASDEPPVYEAPPEYEDVMKPPRSTSRRQRRRRSDSRRSRSSPGISIRRMKDVCDVSEPPILEVRLPREESVRGSIGNVSRLVTPAVQTELSSPVPESPPPPYTTSPAISFRIETPQPKDQITESIEEQRRKTWQIFTDDEQAPDKNELLPQPHQKSLHSRSKSLPFDAGSKESSDVSRSDPTSLFESPCRSNLTAAVPSVVNQGFKVIPSSSPTLSVCNTEPELHCFSSLDSADVVSTTQECVLRASETDQDKYWEEFDKQFQKTEDKFRVDEETEQLPNNVAVLSRRYDSLILNKGNGTKDKAVIKKSRTFASSASVDVTMCDCTDVCECASGFKTNHFQPIRMKRHKNDVTKMADANRRLMRSVSIGGVKEVN